MAKIAEGSATTQYAYDGSMITEEISGSAVARRYVPGPDGTPLLWYEGPGTTDRRWMLKDQQGSVVGVSSCSPGGAAVVDTYDPYGAPGSGNCGGLFQYAGRPWLSQVGLYDNMARSYSPTLGRFLQTDPIGYKDGLNWYAYTHDNPVNKVDPPGKDADSDEWIDDGAEAGGGGSDDGGAGNNGGYAIGDQGSYGDSNDSSNDNGDADAGDSESSNSGGNNSGSGNSGNGSGTGNNSNQNFWQVLGAAVGEGGTALSGFAKDVYSAWNGGGGAR